MEDLFELALFAGAGGGILGGKLLGWKTICAVEIDTYAASILVQRQNDKILESFPIWDDISTFDGKPWKKNIDVVSGGFPCQDISAAGKGTGITGERSGLWGEMARIVCEVESPFVFVENSPLLTLRGLDRVLRDLASMGYDAEWCVLGAENVGAPHKRERIWILGFNSSFSYSYCTRKNQSRSCGNVDENKRHILEQKRAETNPTNLSNTMQMGCSEKCTQTKSRNVIQSSISGRNEETTTMGHAIQRGCSSKSSESKGSLLWKGTETSSSTGLRTAYGSRYDWWTVEPGMGRVVDGVANRMDRIACLGNGQVPRVAKSAWELLFSRMFSKDKK